MTVSPGEDPCSEMALLVQADLDGELRPAEAARLVAHLATCPACTSLQTRLAALSAELRASAPRYTAPPGLRLPVQTLPEPRAARPRRSFTPFGASGAGAAFAALLAVALLRPRPDPLPGELVAAHIRALQPGHLMDVPSTDQHTVKPWFDGRIPFAPPVKDLAASGFPLAGGRIDDLPGHLAATLIYRRRAHIIDLFVWPAATGVPAAGNRDGYNVIGWRSDGMVLAAVSDLNPRELADFVRAWQRGEGQAPPRP